MRNVSLLALAALLVGCGGSSSGDNSFIEGSVGAVNLAFTAGTNYNGSTAVLNSYTSLDGSAAKSVITITATNNNRGIEATLVGTATTGTTFDLSNTSNASGIVYSDATTGTTDRWGSTSGTVTVTSRTATSVQITLTNVVLTNVSSTPSAAGTFTLNGTMTFTATAS